MHRLTTDKATSDMNWTELAYNACYADSHNNARYRDYDMDMDARRLAIKLLGDLADLPNDFTCDEDFDGWMGDYLADGIDSVQGLIAVFYRNLWAMADLREKLKDYEDLEEQGKLLKKWIPSEEPPESGEYVLLSFENFSIPLVGRYEKDDEGDGAFYVGDDEESCISQDIIVNAWMPLPKLYKN